MDKNLKPDISITMITKNRASFIGAAITSVINQTFKNWELLVIDGESKDNTKEIVDSFKDDRIKYSTRPADLGISKSRNIALSNSTGKYIAVLDSDDFWTDNEKLQKQFDFLEQNPNYSLIGSNVKIIDDKGNFIKKTVYKTEDADIRNKILISNQIQHSTVVFRKDFAEKVGGYDEKLPVVEDLDLLLKLGRLGKFKNTKEITTSYTRHSGGISHERKVLMARCHLKVIIRNFGVYPNWLSAFSFGLLRLLKNLIL